jgi:hypothetical protein
LSSILLLGFGCILFEFFFNDLSLGAAAPAQDDAHNEQER